MLYLDKKRNGNSRVVDDAHTVALAEGEVVPGAGVVVVQGPDDTWGWKVAENSVPVVTVHTGDPLHGGMRLGEWGMNLGPTGLSIKKAPHYSQSAKYKL